MNCKRCNRHMKPGIALQSTLVEGVPDMRDDKRGVTLHPGGPGKVVPVLKCVACGYSVTDETKP